MAPERRNQLVLAGLAVVLVALVYRAWSPTSAVAPIASSVTAGGRAAGATSHATAPDVHLDALAAQRPKPSDGDRNLFRFKSRAPARVPPPATPPALPPPAAGPPGPPPIPPIALKFIGFVEARTRGQKIAVLSDEHGVYHGGEGDTIEGRYRILKIGAESIEIAYLDGRGRQTIRLSGS